MVRLEVKACLAFKCLNIVNRVKKSIFLRLQTAKQARFEPAGSQSKARVQPMHISIPF